MSLDQHNIQSKLSIVPDAGDKGDVKSNVDHKTSKDSPLSLDASVPRGHFNKHRQISFEQLKDRNEEANRYLASLKMRDHLKSSDPSISQFMHMMTKNMARPHFWANIFNLLSKDGDLMRSIQKLSTKAQRILNKIHLDILTKQKELLEKILKETLNTDVVLQKNDTIRKELLKYLTTNLEMIFEATLNTVPRGLPVPTLSEGYTWGVEIKNRCELLMGQLNKELKQDSKYQQLQKNKQKMKLNINACEKFHQNLKTVSEKIEYGYHTLYYTQRTMYFAKTGDGKDFNPENFPIHHVISGLFTEALNNNSFGATYPNDPESQRHFLKILELCIIFNDGQYALGQALDMLQDTILQLNKQNRDKKVFDTTIFEKSLPWLQDLHQDMRLQLQMMVLALNARKGRLSPVEFKAEIEKAKEYDRNRNLEYQQIEVQEIHKRDNKETYDRLAIGRKSNVELEVRLEQHYTWFYEALIAKLMLDNLARSLLDDLCILNINNGKSNQESKNKEVQLQKLKEIRNSVKDILECLMNKKIQHKFLNDTTIIWLRDIVNQFVKDYETIPLKKRMSLILLGSHFNYNDPALMSFLAHRPRIYWDEVATPEMPSQKLFTFWLQLRNLEAQLMNQGECLTNPEFSGIVPIAKQAIYKNMMSVVKNTMCTKDLITEFMVPLNASGQLQKPKDSKYDSEQVSPLYELDDLYYTHHDQMITSIVLKNLQQKLFMSTIDFHLYVGERVKAAHIDKVEKALGTILDITGQKNIKEFYQQGLNTKDRKALSLADKKILSEADKKALSEAEKRDLMTTAAKAVLIAKKSILNQEHQKQLSKVVWARTKQLTFWYGAITAQACRALLADELTVQQKLTAKEKQKQMKALTTPGLAG